MPRWCVAGMPITQKVNGAWGMSEGAVMVVTVPESCMEILIGIQLVMAGALRSGGTIDLVA